MPGETGCAMERKLSSCGTAFSAKIPVLALAALVACLLACCFAGTAHAGELAAGELSTSSAKQVQSVTKYKVWVGGKQVTSAGRASYDPSTNTLTLNNAKISGSRVHSITYQGSKKPTNDGIVTQTSATLKIKLVGTSSISVPYRSGMIYATGISCSKPDGWNLNNLTFYGSGKLTVSAPKARCYSLGVTANQITVKDKAKLVAKGAASTEKGKTGKYGGYGFSVSGKVLITGNAQVTASGSKAAFYDSKSTPTFKSYTPKVAYGASAKSAKTKTSPAKSVYTKNKYVKIVKGKAKKSGKPGKVNLVRLEAGYRSFYVVWREFTAAKQYQIQFATNKSFKNATTPPLIAGDAGYTGLAGYTINGATPGTRYYVRIRAKNSKGYGAWSATKSVVPN